MELSNQVSSPGGSRWQPLKMEPLDELSSMVKHGKIIPECFLHSVHICHAVNQKQYTRNYFSRLDMQNQQDQANISEVNIHYIYYVNYITLYYILRGHFPQGEEYKQARSMSFLIAIVFGFNKFKSLSSDFTTQMMKQCLNRS